MRSEGMGQGEGTWRVMGSSVGVEGEAPSPRCRVLWVLG